MKRNNFFIILVLLIASVAVVSCNKAEIAPELSLSNTTETIPSSGGTVAMSFTCNAAWSVDTTGLGWLKLNQISGNAGNATINLTAAANSSGISRSVLLNVISPNGQSRRVTALQAPVIYPSFNTSPLPPNATGMGSTAAQLLSNIKLGWNLYNTLEAHNSETAWGEPLTTQAEIDAVKNAGFNAIRLPCAWHIHMNPATGVIDPVWLARVKQVVQYCINDSMYVLLNCHSDDGFLDCGATGALQDTIKAIQKAIWEQVATTMRDFDEHLMLASANEPSDANYRNGGTGQPHGVTQLQAVTTLQQYHQIFINAVRSTGGKNAYRTLVIQSYSASGDLINYFAGPNAIPGMPTDNVANKLAIEFHYYSPSNFCILSSDASWGPEWCFWGKNLHTTNPALLIRNAQPGTEEGYMDGVFQYINKQYVSQNIPVLVGEYNAQDHSNTLTGYPQDSILSEVCGAHFRAQLVRSAHNNGGIPTFLWAGVIDRNNNTVGDQRTLDSLKTVKFR
jgi:aryl-phospho-beta-D-glucosidase BglC (GH1 family)